MATKEKPQALPPRLAGAPKSVADARKRGVGHYYTMQANLLRLHGVNPPLTSGRPLGRFSPQFPMEGEYEMGVRLWCKVPDNVAVEPPPAATPDALTARFRLTGPEPDKEDEFDPLLAQVAGLLTVTPKAAKRLAQEAAANEAEVRVRLTELVAGGLAVKTKDTFFLTPRYDKEITCRAPQPSSPPPRPPSSSPRSSAATASTPRPKASASAPTAKTSPPPTSSAESRSRKPAKSARRPARRA